MDFGKSFKYYRQKAKLTQKEAAELIGIKDYQLGNYETNRSEPSLDILRRMSRLYRVSIDQMLGNRPFPINSDLIEVVTEGPSAEETFDMIKKFIEDYEKSQIK